METYGRRIGDIPAEIVRAKVLESFGRRIAAVRIMVIRLRGLSPSCAFAVFALLSGRYAQLWRWRRRGGAKGDGCHLNICRMSLQAEFTVASRR